MKQVIIVVDREEKGRIFKGSGVCVLRTQPSQFDGSDASPTMRVGPSKSAYRRRLQTTASGVD